MGAIAAISSTRNMTPTSCRRQRTLYQYSLKRKPSPYQPLVLRWLEDTWREEDFECWSLGSSVSLLSKLAGWLRIERGQVAFASESGLETCRTLPVGADFDVWRFDCGDE